MVITVALSCVPSFALEIVTVLIGKSQEEQFVSSNLIVFFCYYMYCTVFKLAADPVICFLV